MIEIDDVRYCFEACMKILDLLEVVIEFDYGRGSKHPVLTDDGLAVLDGVDVALDEQQV